MATVWEVDGLVAREDVINHLKKDCRPLKRSCAVGPVLEGEFSLGWGREHSIWGWKMWVQNPGFASY